MNKMKRGKSIMDAPLAQLAQVFDGLQTQRLGGLVLLPGRQELLARLAHPDPTEMVRNAEEKEE